MSRSPEALARDFLSAVVRQDARALRPFFAPGAAVRWPCTNERFTVEGYIRANCEYPGDWRGEIERVEAIEHGMVAVSRVWSGEASFHAVSFFRLDGEGRILTLDEYWGDDGAPPAWRAALQLSAPIDESDASPSRGASS